MSAASQRPAWVFSPARRERIYCDESCTSGHRFMGIGGVWIPASAEQPLRDAIELIRKEAGYTRKSEFKWQKCSGRKMREEYARLVDTFFAAADCRFNAIIIDTRNQGANRGVDTERDFYTYLHWLIRKRVNCQSEYDVIIDELTNRKGTRLRDLHDVLNKCGRKDHGLGRDAFREVRATNSKKEDLVQLADILLGATCFHLNGKHTLPGGPARRETASYIARAAGFSGGVIGESRRSKFNVWPWRPRAA